jgi:hypothetical protein
MSAANAVQDIMVRELTYGQTPDLATAEARTIRFTTEGLSGTPTTTQSQENRVDRMSGGQIVTGLEVGGDINGELSPDPAYWDLFEMGMMSAVVPPVPAGVAVALTLTKDAVNPQLATLLITGADLGADGIAVGDVLMLSGFTNPANNGPAQVVEITLPTTAKVSVKRDATDETIAAGDVTRPQYADIGSETISATFSKAYTDVPHLATTDQHSQRYPGGIVNGFNVGLTYGEIVSVVFSILANGYVQEAPSLAQQIETAGGDVLPPGTANPLNASIDLGMVTVDGQPTDYCIESLSIVLDNGNTPQNCLGYAAPMKYVPGTANIAIEASIYLSDSSYDAFMPGKLTMQPVGFLFAAGNMDGGYAFEMPAVQLSFPDPGVTGQNAPVMIDAAGAAKVGPPEHPSALRVYMW